MYNIKATVSSLPQDASAIANLFMASISLDLVLSGRAMCVVCAACVCSMCVWGGRREECEGGVLGGEIRTCVHENQQSHLPKKKHHYPVHRTCGCVYYTVCMYNVCIKCPPPYLHFTVLIQGCEGCSKNPLVLRYDCRLSYL